MRKEEQIIIRQPANPLQNLGSMFEYVGTLYDSNGEPVLTAWGDSSQDVLEQLLDV